MGGTAADRGTFGLTSILIKHGKSLSHSCQSDWHTKKRRVPYVATVVWLEERFISAREPYAQKKNSVNWLILE